MPKIVSWLESRGAKRWEVDFIGPNLKRAKTVISDGTPEETLRWEEDIAPGDFIAVRYGETGKKFHNVGALMGDTNGNGVLDADDLILHAGPYPLHQTPLSAGAFDGHVVVLRP